MLLGSFQRDPLHSPLGVWLLVNWGTEDRKIMKVFCRPFCHSLFSFIPQNKVLLLTQRIFQPLLPWTFRIKRWRNTDRKEGKTAIRNVFQTIQVYKTPPLADLSCCERCCWRQIVKEFLWNPPVPSAPSTHLKTRPMENGLVGLPHPLGTQDKPQTLAKPPFFFSV